jgi:hypothetical protein
MRVLRVFGGLTFAEPYYWQSLLRNAVNYRPGFSYRSVPRNNFLRLTAVNRRLTGDCLEETVQIAENAKAQLRGSRHPTERPNDSLLLLVAQTSLIEAAVSDTITRLCSLKGFRNTALSERRAYARRGLPAERRLVSGLVSYAA